MNESKHSPGPWQYGNETNDKNFTGCKIWDERGQYHIATLSSSEYGRTKEDTIANAKLIAAAPDLLEVCKLVMKFCNPIESHAIPYSKACEVVGKLLSAIEKAEGIVK